MKGGDGGKEEEVGEGSEGTGEDVEENRGKDEMGPSYLRNTISYERNIFSQYTKLRSPASLTDTRIPAQVSSRCPGIFFLYGAVQ